jgi:hypothetical protein
MPRFNLKTTLLVIGLLALWLASFHMVYIGSDIRAAFRFFMLAVPLFCLIYCRETLRAFSIGFLMAAVLPLLRSMNSYIPSFEYSHSVAKLIAAPSSRSVAYSTTEQSVHFISWFAFCLFTGWVSARIFRAQESSPSRDE